MPTPTYTPIASVTLTSATSSVLFNNLPTTGFRDLVLTFQASTTAAGVGVRFRPNSDAGNASSVYMYGVNASTVASSTASVMDIFYTDATTPYSGTLQIMDYARTDKHKTALIRSGSGSSTNGSFVWAFAHRWASTAPITSFELVTSSSTLTAGSTFNLFGIAG